MKGRKSFGSWEVHRIRSLLKKKTKAPRQDQKAIRARIRAHGFYISDFRTGKGPFTAEHFDRLIASGQIRVRGSRLTRLWGWLLRPFPRRDKGERRQ